jgi:HAD superfamily hydrolase (TIGR01509 family)
MNKTGVFRGLIFDFNGVLFWDDDLQRKSWRQFAARIRDELLTDAEIDVHIHGRNGQHSLEYLLGYPISQAEADVLIEQKETIYRQMCIGLGKDFKLSPGAAELLSALVNHKIPHTIATASAVNNVVFFSQHLGLDTWFDVENFVYDDGNTPGKPAPDLYLQAARNLKLGPGECVVIEDSLSGIQAAYNAGIGHVIALGPAASLEELAQIQGVNQVILNLSQVRVEVLFLKPYPERSPAHD